MKSIHINPLTRFSRNLVAGTLAIIILVGVLSCGKKTQRSQLIRKWKLVKQIEQREDLFGPNYTTTYDGQDGDYYKFSTNNTLTIAINGKATEESAYTFSEENMTILRNTPYMVYQVKELTDDKLELTGTWNIGSHTRSHYTVSLKK